MQDRMFSDAELELLIDKGGLDKWIKADYRRQFVNEPPEIVTARMLSWPEWTDYLDHKIAQRLRDPATFFEERLQQQIEIWHVEGAPLPIMRR